MKAGFCYAAGQGFRWWQIYVTYYGMWLLSKVGIVKDLRPVPRRVIDEGRPNTVDMIKNGQIQLIINTPAGQIPRQDENKIRAAAYAHSVCIMTTLTGARAALQGIKALKQQQIGVKPIQGYKGNVSVV